MVLFAETVTYPPVVLWRVGDVHVGMVDRGGQLEVEVIQARGLTPKPGSKCIQGKTPQSPTVLIIAGSLSVISQCIIDQSVLSFAPMTSGPPPPTTHIPHLLSCSSFICEGVRAGKRRLSGQEENQGGEEVLGPGVPAGAALRREPAGPGPAGGS